MTNEKFKKQIHRELTDASVKIFEKVGEYYEFRGTGFFITPDGYLLTAYHCVGESPDDIFVKTHFDGKFKAVLDQRKSLRDSEYDIAVLKIDYQPNHYLPLGMVSDEHIMDEVVAVGYPAGHKPENTQIKTFIGNISRFHRAPNLNFDLYFKSEILGKTNKPVLWGIDEADRLFLCNFSSEVFALFRTWHNERALNPATPCSRLTLAIAYATETYL
jgi:hypothetical protein